MPTMDIGYNLVEAREIREGILQLFSDRMSIVRFLQVLSDQEELPRDVTVTGLEGLLYYAEDVNEVSALLRGILVDAVNKLIPINPIIQVVFEGELQQWEHPEIRYLGKRLPLRPIFGGSLRQRGVNYFHAEINVLS